MKYPHFLPKGGAIGFVAPSFGCNTEPYRTAFNHALDTFCSMGYKTVLGPNCYEGSGVGISNTPEKCGAELMDFYLRGDSDILISCGGGELMCEDLPFVDFDRLSAAEPKWYMGFSDNTNMTFLLTTLCDTASVYGPCAAAFGMEPWHASLNDAMEILTGRRASVSGYDLYEEESVKDEEHPLAPYHVSAKCVKRRFPDTDCTVSGRLLGGCLDILNMFPGTCYDHVAEFNEKYSGDGILWFLESCDLNPMAIRRALWQLDQAGWFARAKGFLIGRPLCHGQEILGMDQYNAVTGILGKYNVPIIMDLDIGHIPPMMPLVCGSFATARISGNDFSIDMEMK